MVFAGDKICVIGIVDPTNRQRIGTPLIMALRPVARRLGLRSTAARRSKPLRKRQRNGTSRRGKPWRLLRVVKPVSGQFD